MSKPPITWRNMRLPAELHTRLADYAASLDAAHARGAIILPSDQADGVALHHALARLLDEVESRRERSRRPRKRDVYTPAV